VLLTTNLSQIAATITSYLQNNAGKTPKYDGNLNQIQASAKPVEFFSFLLSLFFNGL